MCCYHAQEEMTALIWSASKGTTDCARLLLDAGADTQNADEVRHWWQCLW
jgi:ankyrin repeat protein